MDKNLRVGDLIRRVQPHYGNKPAGLITHMDGEDYRLWIKWTTGAVTSHLVTAVINYINNGKWLYYPVKEKQ